MITLQQYAKYAGIVFMDIETVPCVNPAKLLTNEFEHNKYLEKKINKQISNHIGVPNMHKEAVDYCSLHVELCKIACISFGYITKEGEIKKHSVCSDDESTVISNSYRIINDFWNSKYRKFQAYNGKGFDYPILMRKFISYGYNLPEAFKIHDKKPWEIGHLLDLCELMKFTQWNGNVSLEGLCILLNVPSPKDGMTGAAVAEMYYSEDPKRIDKIAQYCEGDVRALIDCHIKVHECL